jgi:hypothetical protein
MESKKLTRTSERYDDTIVTLGLAPSISRLATPRFPDIPDIVPSPRRQLSPFGPFLKELKFLSSFPADQSQPAKENAGSASNCRSWGISRALLPSLRRPCLGVIFELFYCLLPSVLHPSLQESSVCFVSFTRPPAARDSGS